MAIKVNVFLESSLNGRPSVAVIFRSVNGQLLPPTLQVREIHLHLADVFFLRNRLGKALVYLIDKLSAMLYHFVHGAFLQEFTITIAEHTIVFILATVGIGAQHMVVQRHAATLTEFHFFFHIHKDTLFTLLPCCLHPLPQLAPKVPNKPSSELKYFS